jgi:phosphoglycerol transferase MdoB-like AlkP superfamily enzyme
MLSNKINIPSHIRFLFMVYLWGILFFMLFRFLLLLTNISELTLHDYILLPQSFLYGFRFDTSISCYILSFPFVILSLGSVLRPFRKAVLFFSHYLLIILYIVAFFVCCADIPYFNHFSSRISTASLLWVDSPMFMVKMILGTFSFWIYLLPFFGLSMLFVRQINKAKQKAKEEVAQQTNLFSVKSLVYFLLLAPFLFLGIRGRIAKKSPMVTGTAYFCENNFLNQLGLNPVFTFMSSYVEDHQSGSQRLHLMNDTLAINNVKGYLNSGRGFDSPVARNIIATGEPHKMNVVFVIMEGMSRFNMGKYGGSDTITPALNSLKKKSLWFENIFTQGIHTFNGIYSSLYSYPSLLKKHPLRNIPGKEYYSMPQVLKDSGYRTLFFITHDGQFDNAQGFLTSNGFDKVYAESDYPSEKVLSTLGVPDDYLFDYSIPKMNEIFAQGKYFFSGFMTGSNHNPIIIPDWIKKKFISGEEYVRIIQYSDWAIGEFMKNASLQSWYNNTIFVFVADHGANLLHTYDMPLAFHHTPLIIFAPGLHLEPKTYDCMGGQIDIFPTLMGLMNLSYINNTMGIDLLKEKRPYIYFTADDKIGCIDKDFYFIHRNGGNETLYRYADLATDNYLEKYKSRADSMRTYAYSMLQATQWIVEEEKFSKK